MSGRSSSALLILLFGLFSAAGSSSPRNDVIQSGEKLIQRVLGTALALNFTVCTLEAEKDGKDTFDLSIPTVGHVQICGTSGVAVARGLYHYLRVVCKSSITWGRNGSGDNLNVPTPLPGVTSFHVRKTSTVKWRYYMNVCTVSYSSVWWDWRRWEREIDWMALHGINLPLAFNGQEYVIADVFKSLGVTEEEMQVYFTGPAFFAWNRMANLRSWGGPLTPNMREQQFNLQLQILGRMRELGMTPVLPGFSGHVPLGVKRRYPNADVQRNAYWAHFGANYSGDYYLTPTDPLFQTVGVLYYQRQAQLMGTDHIYNVDNFNEMTPPSGDPEYLAKVSAAVYSSMKAADPNATWLMQSWLFMSGFWSQERTWAYLSPVPDDRMIILDLYAEVQPFWSRYKSFYGKPFIWSMLHNFGGRRVLLGNLNHIAQAPHNALHTNGSTMNGIGLTPEAIEQNPVVYELMTDTAWSDTPIDVATWLKEYIERRYRHGSDVSGIQNAWSILSKSVYTLNWLERFTGLMHLTPTFPAAGVGQDGKETGPVKPMLSNMLGLVDMQPGSPSTYHGDAVTAAWRELVTGAAAVQQEQGQISGPLSYDLVDTGRQVLVDLHADLVLLMSGAYARWLSNNATQVAKEISSLGDAMQDVLMDLEQLLASDKNYLLGTWLQDARAMGADDMEKDIFLMNAKNQVTMWGPLMGYLNDYAEKHWSGLVGTYYVMRWRFWMEEILLAVSSGKPADPNAFTAVLDEFQTHWYRDSTLYPAEASGDPVALSVALVKKWAEAPKEGKFFIIKDATVTGNNLHLPGYGLNAHDRVTSRDIEQMKLLCYLDAACAGFTSDGILKSDVTEVNTVSGSTLYVRI